MSTPEETFAAFVDAVAAALDEPTVDGTQLAARMHLSRFHLDRILTGVAGEPPAHFRRRILLERAAYRLATGTDTVLDIAIEAGYASHEAFTRAFRRAYGRTPSVWRRAPGGLHLATPNGVHFHPPGRLRLPARTKVSSMDLLTTMVEHHLHVLGTMLDRARTLTDEQLDAPIELSVMGIDRDPTIRSLLSRLVGQLQMWNCSLASRPYDFSLEDLESLDSIAHRFAEHGPLFLEQLRTAVAEGRLEDTFVDAAGESPYVFTYGAMLAHVLTYAAHRRTLVVGALASLGADLEDDPLQWPALSP